jgi:hypothetical protein
VRTLDPTSKGFKHLVEEYSVPSGQAGADALFKTLCVAFRRRYGISSRRFVENVVCKAYQWAVSGAKYNYRDIFYMGSHCFPPRTTGGGRAAESIKGPFLSRFILLGRELSLKEIGEACVPDTCIKFNPTKTTSTEYDKFGVPRIYALN